MKYLITGGAGFLGSNLAAEVLSKNEELLIIDGHLRTGCEENLSWLNTLGDFQHHQLDIKDKDSVAKVFSDYKPDIIFHVAGPFYV